LILEVQRGGTRGRSRRPTRFAAIAATKTPHAQFEWIG
jgi:hypothetical protein